MCSGGESNPVSHIDWTITSSRSSSMSLTRCWISLFCDGRRTCSADRPRVVRAAGVDDLDLALVDVVVMPVRLYGDNLLVEIGADLARGAHDDSLAGTADELAHLLRAGLPVPDQVLGEDRTRSGAPYSAFITATACWMRSRSESSSPAVASSARSSISSGSTSFGRFTGMSAALVVDRDRGLVVHRPGQVVDVDVVAEHVAGVALGRRRPACR